MAIDTITLDDALRLLSLPRVVGTDAEGVEITAQNGRYGPYLKKGTDSRSLASEEQLFDITLDEALAIYAQPKQRGRAAAAPPLGARRRPGQRQADRRQGRPLRRLRHRRRDNATLRKDDTDGLTPERAADLLAEKRAMGPTTRKRAVKKTAKKTTKTRRRAPPRRPPPRRPDACPTPKPIERAIRPPRARTDRSFDWPIRYAGWWPSRWT